LRQKQFGGSRAHRRAAEQAGEGRWIMGDHRWIVRRLRAFFSRRAMLLAVRAMVILSMSFAAAFGFLAAMRSPGSHYDPHLFAIGAAALFGAACGAIGIMFSRNRTLRQELRGLREHTEDLSDRNWELRKPRSGPKVCSPRKAT
jgi:hypothetical protein